MTKQVVVLDYGIGNVHSVYKAVAAAGAEVCLTGERQKILEADGLIVPGVGAFAAVMAALAKANGPELIDRRLSGDRPVFGICVGLQIMFETGVEGATTSTGLAQWPGTVEKLPAEILPHMGWNTVRAAENSSLFAGISDERFYFVHSYAAKNWNLDVAPPFPQPAVTWANYGSDFIAAVENGPLSGTQFHPEKSGLAGLRLLQNWVKTL